MYVQERRAGQERKDRDEIEALGNEVRVTTFQYSHSHAHIPVFTCLFQVEQLRGELSSREERWKVSLNRQRVRVEALEGQNRELQGDLLMMERERLAWWQQQVNGTGCY